VGEVVCAAGGVGDAVGQLGRTIGGVGDPVRQLGGTVPCLRQLAGELSRTVGHLVGAVVQLVDVRLPGADLVLQVRDGGEQVLRVAAHLLGVVVDSLQGVVDLTGAVRDPAGSLLQVRERLVVGQLGMLLDQGRQGVVHLIGAGGQRAAAGGHPVGGRGDRG